MADTTATYSPESPSASTAAAAADHTNGVIIVTRGQGANVSLVNSNGNRPLPLLAGPDAYRIAPGTADIVLQYAMVYPAPDGQSLQWSTITAGDANEDPQGYLTRAQAIAGNVTLTVQVSRRLTFTSLYGYTA